MQKRGSKKIKDRASYEPSGPSVGWLIDRLVVGSAGRWVGWLVGLEITMPTPLSWALVLCMYLFC